MDGTPFVAIKASHLKRWIADMEHAELAASTIGLARMIVKASLELAVQDELLARNPMTGVRAPALPRSVGKSLTVAQAQQLLLAACGHRLELRSKRAY